MPRPDLPFRLADQLDWAKSIACQVASGYSLTFEQREDLIQQAHLHCTELYVRKFNLDYVPPGGDAQGAFRGWACRGIRTEVIREAERLGNGGTFHTCRPENRPAPVAVLGDDAEGLADEETQECWLDSTPSTRGYRSETLEDCSLAPYGRRLARRLTIRA